MDDRKRKEIDLHTRVLSADSRTATVLYECTRCGCFQGISYEQFDEHLKDCDRVGEALAKYRKKHPERTPVEE